MATNPDTLVLIICLMAFLIGPCLYISLYTIAFVINLIIQYSSPNHQPPFKLGPETVVSCPDGHFYLAIFRRDCYDRVIQHIGHFPSIYALSTVPIYYRRQSAKGIFKLIGDNLAYYKPQLYGDPAWEIVEKLTLPLHLIGSKELARISTKPPQGYSYIEIFQPLQRTHIMTMLGYCPHLQDLMLINPEYHLHTKGILWDTGEHTCKVVLYWAENTSQIWEEIRIMAEHHPNDRITG